MSWFWRILFFGSVAFGLYAWFGKRQAGQQRIDRGQSFADLFSRQTLDFKDDSTVVEKNFYRALAFAHDYHDPQPPIHFGTPPDGGWRPLLSQALTERDFSQNEVTLLIDALEDALGVCDNLGVWETQANAEALEAGNPPSIRSGTFEGERLRISFRLTPAIAPQARNHPANFQLVPESVWALQPDRLDPDAFRFAERLHSAKIIDGQTKASVSARWDAIQKKNS